MAHPHESRSWHVGGGCSQTWWQTSPRDLSVTLRVLDRGILSLPLSQYWASRGRMVEFRVVDGGVHRYHGRAAQEALGTVKVSQGLRNGCEVGLEQVAN